MTEEKDRKVPNPELRIDINGEPVRLKMSYGLLSSLAAMVDSPENVAMLGMSPRLCRDLCLVAVVPRDEEGDPTMKTDREIDAILDQLTTEDGQAVTDWVQEHLIDFFMRGVSSTQTALKSLSLAEDESSTASSTGSKTSPSKKVSAGASA